MILACPECKSRYVVNPTALLPSGRTVRCAKCSHSWFQEKPDDDVKIVPPEQPEGEDTKPSPDEQQDANEESVEKKTDEQSPVKNNDTGTSSDDFDFPINNPRKRRRPIPKGSNLPALQNQKYGSSKTSWVSLAIFITVIICSFMIFQDTIIQSWPASQKLYTAIGLDGGNTPEAHTEPELEPINERLDIGGITPRRETINNVSHLVIAGYVENISSEIQEIPTLKVILLDQSRKNVRDWSFSPQTTTINPGEKINFETSLPSPPPEARDISVEFSTN